MPAIAPLRHQEKTATRSRAPIIGGPRPIPRSKSLLPYALGKHFIPPQATPMDTTTLGRTHLKVSVAGLGGGGHSRLGTSYGKDFDHAVGVVRRALDLGVNLIDTATNYETEPHVGQAISPGPPRLGRHLLQVRRHL